MKLILISHLKKVFIFIEKVLDHIIYTNTKNRYKCNFPFEEINKVLLFIGLEVTKQGPLIQAVKAKSLDEVHRRVNQLGKQLYNRYIHNQVENIV